MITIDINIKNGEADVKLDMDAANNADIQAAIANLEMLKIGLIKNLASSSSGFVDRQIEE